MTNLRDHVKAWLESIGADGLMMPDKSIELIKADLPQNSWFYLVPAYRHADGSYHTTKEIPIEDPCRSCAYDDDPFCGRPGGPCEAHKAWYKQRIDNKEETK